MPKKPRPLPAVGQPLTERELQVLQALADDCREKVAAHRLGISTDTVSVFKRLIYRKLGVVSAPGAVAVGFRQGLVK